MTTAHRKLTAPAPGFAEQAAAFTSFRALEQGVPAAWVRSLESQGLTRDDIRRIIPDRTLDRRIAKGEMLKIEEADGLARLLRVVKAARDLFENDENADMFLRSPNPALGERIPIHMAQTDIGAREVETIIGRLSHGIYS
ncbi:MAG: antitoxin Xre/MbcA/ParS toxin-binding domain-containing protein [Pseudomonadota bacterium]